MLVDHVIHVVSDSGQLARLCMDNNWDLVRTISGDWLTEDQVTDLIMEAAEADSGYIKGLEFQVEENENKYARA